MSHWESAYSKDEYIRDKRVYPNLVSIAGHELLPTDLLVSELPDAVWHTVIREPLSRTVSDYQHKVEKLGVEMPFEEWFDRRRNLMTRMICGESSAARAIERIRELDIVVGVSEHYDKTLMMLFAMLGVPYMRRYNVHLNREKHGRVKEQLLQNANLVRIISSGIDEDVKLYNFVMTTWFDRCQKIVGNRFDYHSKKRPRKSLELLNRLHRNLVYKPYVSLRSR